MRSTALNGRYGWHRDELVVLDDAKHLAWGYVVYPPVTPFLCRVSLILFGPSLVMLRLLAAAAQGVAMVLTGLMARELGATRFGEIVAGVAAAIGEVSFVSGLLFQYLSFDYLWWVLIAYFVIRLLKLTDYFFFAPNGKRHRMIGWMYAILLALFLIAKGRGYYLAPAYPMLLAGGAAWGGRRVARLTERCAA